MNRRSVLRGALLGGALILSAHAQHALAVPSVPDACPGPQGFQTSAVLDVVQAASGRFDYGFRVCNTSTLGEQQPAPLLRDWELPFFGSGSGTTIDLNASGITDIATPANWSWSIETIGTPNEATGWEGTAEWQTAGNPMKVFFDAFFGSAANNPYNSVTHVLHFYTDCFFEGPCAPIFPNASLEGFGFTADFDSTNAPYQASWLNLPVQTGDPQFPLGGQPANPVLLQALANVPEPGTVALLGLALGIGMTPVAARRRVPR